MPSFAFFGYDEEILCREREQQRQAKHASAEQDRTKKESAADSATAQPAQTAVAVLASSDVEDSQLPGAHRQPPLADPVGRGLLTPHQLSGTKLNILHHCM